MVAVGWTAGAMIFYSLHRWVFHSKRTSWVYKFLFHPWNPLRALALKGRETHMAHHKESIKYGPDVTQHMAIFFPLWAKLFVVGVVTASAFVFGALPTIGLVSFFPFYAYRHHLAHTVYKDPSNEKKNWVKHHMHHHFKNPQANFSGTVPIIDRIFNTYDKL